MKSNVSFASSPFHPGSRRILIEPLREQTLDQFAMIRAIRTIGITGITKPVMIRKIAITTFSARLDSCQIDYQCHRRPVRSA